MQGGGELPPGTRIISPQNKRGLRWRIQKECMEAEMRRQSQESGVKIDKVDLKFCLTWHAQESFTEGQLVRDLAKFGDPQFSSDRHSLAALVHFMLLEHLELITEDGSVTVLGNVLKDTPRQLQEPCLVALEMMKFVVLSGEPFEAAMPDRPFPEQVNYP